MSISAVVLAAGKARRMGGVRPKALYKLGGEPLIFHVIREIQKIKGIQLHIVVGFGGTQVQEAVSCHFKELHNIHWHQQAEQLGTAHAVSQALPTIANHEQVIIAYADMPFINAANYRALLDIQKQHDVVFMSAMLKDPTGYGRILRTDGGEVARIIEQADASVDEYKIKEVNLGIMASQSQTLNKLIKEIKNDNKQHEYYLTDCIQLAVNNNLKIGTCELPETWRASGINTLAQYTVAERLLQRARVSELIARGAIVRDTNRLDVRGKVQLGQDVVFDVGVVLEGEIELGDRVEVGAYSVLKDASIAADTMVKPFSYIEGAHIGKSCIVGPYARIRPNTRIGDDNRIGNFVEIKETTTGAYTKVNHLSYIGDSDIGSQVNIGAGTITCNYDGAQKHRTRIGDDVFVGSDTQIVAPVEISSKATIGAGSTITRDVPADKLTLSRCQQTTVTGWKRPSKKSK
ncbi:MAG: bifunctional UDP-N-acetylglucosamine diphosphorylase/glucosamine-1-phosphate N-acetyltransferase GlmU [Chromatiales bacterium]|nr:bifunctional UDP-N-acetylglucosamine diphosphorylase/glucosamine-1-phosphate N-acetyltransferase GlmU [Chromatiales bacterium]